MWFAACSQRSQARYRNRQRKSRAPSFSGVAASLTSDPTLGRTPDSAVVALGRLRLPQTPPKKEHVGSRLSGAVG
jgi:hypothetical protein